MSFTVILNKKGELEALLSAGALSVTDGFVRSMMKVTDDVCIFPTVSFAVIVTEYVPSASDVFVKFQFPYVARFVPNLPVSFIFMVSEFVSDAVPTIESAVTERLALLEGLVIESDGFVVSIFIVDDAVVSVFPFVSFDAYRMYDVPSVDICTGTVYAVLGLQLLSVSVQYLVLSHPTPAPSSQVSVTLMYDDATRVLNV